MASSAGRSATSSVLNDSYRAVGLVEDFVGNAPDISLADLIDAIDRAKRLPPIAVASLIGGKLRGKSLIVGEAANQIGFAAGLDHLELFVGDVFFLQAINLRVDRVGHFLRLVAGQG